MIRKIFVISLFLFCVVNAQTKDDQILAKVGTKTITVEEFRKRYEFMPQVGRHIKNSSEGLKNQLLYTLIAEKLWAQEAEANSFDTTLIMSQSFKALEKMYARDALYRHEIMDKVTISEDDYKEAYFRQAVVHYVDYIYSQDENEIFWLHSELDKGVGFDVILNQRPEKQLQTEPYKVEFGQMEKAVEDAIYGLSKGGYTKPVKAPEGYYIFRLLSMERNDLSDVNKANELMKKVRKILRETKEDSLYDVYYGNFFKGRKITTNGHIFWSFSNHVIDLIRGHKTNHKIAAGEKIHLAATDYYKLEKRFGPDTLKMSFVEFDNKPVTVQRFLREFIFEGFYTVTTSADTIRAQLNSRVRSFIEKELLAREAYGRKMQHSPKVASDIKMWRDFYLATAMKSSVKEDSRYTEEEARKIYNGTEKGELKSIKVNIQEILTDSLEVVERIFTELDGGAEFGALAKKYTIRDWTKERNGEFGYFPMTEYGEIGATAADMEVGEIFGPLDTPDGFSIFKLIGKKVDDREFDKPFGEVKAGLMKQLDVNKYTRNVINKTGDLADKYGVEVYENNLSDLKVTEFNMVVYKYFGFGGKASAVPMMAPFTEWVKPWKEGRKILP